MLQFVITSDLIVRYFCDRIDS